MTPANNRGGLRCFEKFQDYKASMSMKFSMINVPIDNKLNLKMDQ
jgi:hypothetical protein